MYPCKGIPVCFFTASDKRAYYWPILLQGITQLYKMYSGKSSFLPSTKEPKDRNQNMWVKLNTDLLNYTSSSLLSSLELVLELLSHTMLSVNTPNHFCPTLMNNIEISTICTITGSHLINSDFELFFGGHDFIDDITPNILYVGLI